MYEIFLQADVQNLRAPHVARAWFLKLEFPNNTLYLHNGVGNVEVMGQTWLGVTDPVGGRLVDLGQVEEPTTGSAAAVNIVLTGVNKDFIRWVHDNAANIEGQPATIYWAAFDGETQKIIIEPKALFPRGIVSAPSIKWAGVGQRTISLVIENIWSAFNFAPGGKWNGADQRRRYSGDLGLDFVGVEITENWR